MKTTDLTDININQMRKQFMFSYRFISKAKSILMLLSFILVSFLHTTAQNNLIDFASIDKFWPIYNQLKLDQEPSDSDWQNLFLTDGMQVLLKSEFEESYFKNYYRLAFMPSMHDSLLLELSGKDWKKIYLSHLQHIIENEGRIKDEIKNLKTHDDSLYNSLKNTIAFLPADISISNDLPTVSFVFFGNDARGYSQIIIDFLYYINNKEAMNYLVAHEAHHFYRNKYLKLSDTYLNNAEQTIVMVLNQLQAEGMADQIDKPFIYFNNGLLSDSKWANRYKEQFNQSNIVIRKMDSILIQINSNPETMDQLAEEFKSSVPMSGHPTGYYMANAIIEILGKDALIHSWTDPFEFVLLYQKAAKKSSHQYPVFSDQSLELVKEYQNLYIIE